MHLVISLSSRRLIFLRLSTDHLTLPPVTKNRYKSIILLFFILFFKIKMTSNIQKKQITKFETCTSCIENIVLNKNMNT